MPDGHSNKLEKAVNSSGLWEWFNHTVDLLKVRARCCRFKYRAQYSNLRQKQLRELVLIISKVEASAENVKGTFLRERSSE